VKRTIAILALAGTTACTPQVIKVGEYQVHIPVDAPSQLDVYLDPARPDWKDRCDWMGGYLKVEPEGRWEGWHVCVDVDY
jgi:hypothetical protein